MTFLRSRRARRIATRRNNIAAIRRALPTSPTTRIRRLMAVRLTEDERENLGVTSEADEPPNPSFKRVCGGRRAREEHPPAPPPPQAAARRRMS
jgi:hypothetical protein